MRPRLEAMVEGLAALGEGDVYGLRQTRATARLKSGILEAVRHQEMAGAGLRAICHGRMGAAGGTLHVPIDQLLNEIRDVRIAPVSTLLKPTRWPQLALQSNELGAEIFGPGGTHSPKAEKFAAGQLPTHIGVEVLS
mgnify:CR=1 FL=1